MKFEHGMAVHATDGYVGTVDDLVVDPTTQKLTHLVVDVHHRGHSVHVIPIGAIHPEATVGRSEIVLLWTRADIDNAPRAQLGDIAVPSKRIGACATR